MTHHKNICCTGWIASIQNFYPLDDCRICPKHMQQKKSTSRFRIWCIKSLSAKKNSNKHDITIPNAGEKKQNKNFPTLFKGHCVATPNNVLSLFFHRFFSFKFHTGLVEAGKFHLGLFTSDDDGWDFVEESFGTFWRRWWKWYCIIYNILQYISYNIYYTVSNIVK